MKKGRPLIGACSLIRSNTVFKMNESPNEQSSANTELVVNNVCLLTAGFRG